MILVSLSRPKIFAMFSDLIIHFGYFILTKIRSYLAYFRIERLFWVIVQNLDFHYKMNHVNPHKVYQ